MRNLLLAVLAVLLGTTLLRSFVGDVYSVESTSMEPTIHARPEQVFVRYDRGFLPRRFGLVVFSSAAFEAGAVVKRAVFLPGESGLISGGDLLVEGRRLGADVPRPLPIEVFDSRREPLEPAFAPANGVLEPRPGGWRLDASSRRVDLAYARRARDDRYDADGKWVSGSVEVNDLRLEGRFTFEGTGKLTLRLTEEGDGFELELELQDGRLVRSRVLRRAGSAELESLAEIPPPSLAAGAPCAVVLENVDNHLLAEVAGARVCVDYDANTPLQGVVNDKDRHLQPRAALAVAGMVLGIERLGVLRDVYYTGEGRYGTGSPVSLGPDEVFTLGDNSSDSRDSRTFGPVRLEEIAGKAAWVVWPLSGLRRLGDLRVLRPAQVGP